MRQFGAISLIVCLAAASGCNVCCWGKRASELGSPTDIRKAHYWCLGEDAVFQQPCGPSKEDFGLKATCWREWPADGGRCKPGTCPPGTNCGPGGNCGPAMRPSNPLQPAAPPAWERATPTEVLQGPNPFQDDEPTLPAPTGGSAMQFQTPKSAAVSARRSPQRVTTPATPDVQLSKPTKLTSAAGKDSLLPPRATKALPVVVPPPMASAQKMTVERQRVEPALRIAVSTPIDDPVRQLPPIAAPNSTRMRQVTDSNRPTVEAATLAGLEKMVDVPAMNSKAEPEPLVLRNEFAPAATPFRLPTRATTKRPANDPTLQKQTLSALESMLAD